MAAKLVAILDNGERVESSPTLPSIDYFPVDRIVELRVESDKSGVPLITIMADLEAGDRVHRFTRNTIAMRPSGQERGRMSVEVYEIRRRGKTHARLYWHPVVGPILTTRDLDFDVPV